MSVREQDNPELYKRTQKQNLLRQYDLLSNCIEVGLEKGIESVRKIHALGSELCRGGEYRQFGGRYRERPI